MVSSDTRGRCVERIRGGVGTPHGGGVSGRHPTPLAKLSFASYVEVSPKRLLSGA